MSFNFPNKELQMRYEYSFIFANGLLHKFFYRDIGRDHLKFLMKQKTKGIVEHDRRCSKVQKELDKHEKGV